MNLADIALDGGLFVKVLVTVTVIMDPVGNIPVFLALTRGSDGGERRRAALQASSVAAVVILCFALFGEVILRVLGITLPSLQAAGGLLLGIIALELLRPFDEELSSVATDGPNVALVPLGTPLLAGPGAIATTMVYMRAAGDLGGALSVVLALLASLAVTYAALRHADLLARVLKTNGVHVLSRVMGLLVAAIAVQMVAEAVETWTRSGVS